MELPFIERRPDLDALLTPARFQISPLTGFCGIQKLPPAHYLIFEGGRLTLQEYWRIEPREENPAESVVIEEMDALLRDSVRLQMIADRPVGTFLSGGLDSSIISALMRANTTSDIHAFTVLLRVL